MSSLLAYGMSIQPGPRHLDLTPVVAILAAILIVRFVIGLALTPPTLVGAAFAGALWAYLAEPLGVATPTLVAFLLIVVIRRIRRQLGRV